MNQYFALALLTSCIAISAMEVEQSKSEPAKNKYLQPNNTLKFPSLGGFVAFSDKYAVNYIPDAIKIWDITEGKLISCHPSKATIKAAAISPDNSWVAVALYDHPLGVDNNKIVWLLPIKKDGPIQSRLLCPEDNPDYWLYPCVAFSPNSKYTAYGASYAYISNIYTDQNWRCEGGSKDDTVYAVAFSPDSNYIVIALCSINQKNRSYQIRVHTTVEGNLKSCSSIYNIPTSSIAVAQDDTLYIASGYREILHFNQTPDGLMCTSKSSLAAQIRICKLLTSPCNNYILALSEDYPEPRICVYNLEGKCLATLYMSPPLVAFSVDSKQIIIKPINHGKPAAWNWYQQYLDEKAPYNELDPERAPNPTSPLPLEDLKICDFQSE